MAECTDSSRIIASTASLRARSSLARSKSRKSRFTSLWSFFKSVMASMRRQFPATTPRNSAHVSSRQRSDRRLDHVADLTVVRVVVLGPELENEQDDAAVRPADGRDHP